MSEDLLSTVRHHADLHADAEGLAATPIPGVAMMRAEAPSAMTKSIYRPLICLILQGAKEVLVGSNTHEFAAGQTAIIAADVPVLSRITCASRAEPYLALAIDLDPALIDELAGAEPPPAPTASPVLLAQTDAAVGEAALRLVRLTERPAAIAPLRPAILRELHYWLLAGRHGTAVRHLTRPGGPARQLARAMALLRAEFDQPLPVRRLAAAAGMSASAFHAHFRAVTSLSPLQFQKQLRLIEARRRMRAEGLAAGRAAEAVGYRSVSQFSREYGRMFGRPPARDQARDAPAPG